MLNGPNYHKQSLIDPSCTQVRKIKMLQEIVAFYLKYWYFSAHDLLLHMWVIPYHSTLCSYITFQFHSINQQWSCHLIYEMPQIYYVPYMQRSIDLLNKIPKFCLIGFLSCAHFLNMLIFRSLEDFKGVMIINCWPL